MKSAPEATALIEVPARPAFLVEAEDWATIQKVVRGLLDTGTLDATTDAQLRAMQVTPLVLDQEN